MESIALWKYNGTTGIWGLQRHCETTSAAAWLEVFQKDQPDCVFRLAKRQPKEILTGDDRPHIRFSSPLQALRHHVTGAIARGEAFAIVNAVSAALNIMPSLEDGGSV